METQTACLESPLIIGSAAHWRRRTGDLAAQRSFKAVLALLALLTVAFPIAAQQSMDHARAGTLTRATTVDVLRESAPLSVARAAPTVPRQRGARLLHPKNSASPSSAQVSRAPGASV